jgi:hypothetical protein
VKINGRIRVTFAELGEALGLPESIIVEMVTCPPDDMDANYFTIHVFDESSPESLPGNASPYLEHIMLSLDATQEARRKVVAAVMELHGERA